MEELVVGVVIGVALVVAVGVVGLGGFSLRVVVILGVVVVVVAGLVVAIVASAAAGVGATVVEAG